MNDYPRLLHHGAATGVTGSCHRLQIAPDRALLVDCGLFQGQDAEHRDSLDQQRGRFPVDDVLALVATHVYIDHIGRLPYLLAAGYQGPILCSVPSVRLLPLVIEDALKIGFTRDRALIERFLEEVTQRLMPLDYRAWHTVLNDERHRLRVKLQRAGHILSSAYVEVESLDKVQGQPHRAVFSGDLGAPHTPLLPAPRLPYRADTLVLESTYGDRRHEDRRHRQARLKAAINRALENGGTVIVPAFSIGRTQELLYELEGLIHCGAAGSWHDLEIIVDSPLAARSTEVYRELSPWWDAEAHRRLRGGRHPLSFENLYTVASHEELERTVDYLATSHRRPGGQLPQTHAARRASRRGVHRLPGCRHAGPRYLALRPPRRLGGTRRPARRYPRPHRDRQRLLRPRRPARPTQLRHAHAPPTAPCAPGEPDAQQALKAGIERWLGRAGKS